MKFTKKDFTEIKLNSDSHVSDYYVTSIQCNEFQSVTITNEQCRESVLFLSRLRDKHN